MKIGALLLAAGGSTRLGRAKQLLPIQGETLIHRTLRSLIASGVHPVLTVLGAEAGRCVAEIADLGGAVTIHSLWRDGLASSLAAGLKALIQLEPNLDAAVIALCDQPFLQSSVIDRLIEKHLLSGKGMVASRYADGSLGAPALYARTYFEELLTLEGDRGARSLLQRYPADVAFTPFPLGGMDVDTPEQYSTLRKNWPQYDRQHLTRAS